MALTKKQQRFCEEYLLDLNATQAAIRAGYSEKTANEQGSRLLANVSVVKFIQSAIEKRTERTEINTDYVLNRLSEIDKMSVRDIMNDDMTLKPLKDWPEVWCSSISAIDVSEIASGQKDSDAALAFIKKLKWPDTMKALELIGKHVDVQAFNEKREITGANGGPIQTQHEWTINVRRATPPKDNKPKKGKK